MKISLLIAQYAGDPLGLLHALGGYYECPRDQKTGERLGPLVGYAASYLANFGSGTYKQYVGDVYANFAKAEERPVVIDHYAKKLLKKLASMVDDNIVFVGPQMGGISIAQFLAYNGREFDARYACAEKKITQVASSTGREVSELQFGRHTIGEGDKVIIVEDVLNNFSTTRKTIDLIESLGATVSGICSILNRSPKFTDDFHYKDKEDRVRRFPIIALVEKPFPEYEQHEEAVVGDIISGNVIWKPKDKWDELMASMNANKQIA